MGQSDMIEETLVLYSLWIKDFAGWKELEYQLMFTETLIFWHAEVFTEACILALECSLRSGSLGLEWA